MVYRGTKSIVSLNTAIKAANMRTGLTVSVICPQSKAFYLKNPKMVQRLPRETRAYWYWFLKNHS
ncbi:hypothetical protein ACF3NA_08580 [Alkanindiges sp. WGS2144]|uniref:hypothetical protein n=1 Tax=Alkanindiges sp. WGS2144 TaxID=3366808 RepID=UPI003750A9FC